MANANWSNAGKIYSPYVKPVLLTCNFIVDSTNGNGLGIRSLKGPGNPYVIVSLGTATLAQWVAKGLPVGITPAVGVAFVANASGTIGGSAAVQAPLSTGSGVDHFEVIGDPNLTLGGQAPSGPTGAFIVVQSFLSNVLTQPANGSVIGLSFWMSDSSVTVNGQ